MISHNLSCSLAHSRVEHRIVSTLIALLPEFGKSPVQPQLGYSIGSSKDSAFTSSIYMTRKELADLTGTTPETAIRVTKHLEREGLLDLTRPGIIKILDINKFAKQDFSM